MLVQTTDESMQSVSQKPVYYKIWYYNYTHLSKTLHIEKCSETTTREEEGVS